MIRVIVSLAFLLTGFAVTYAAPQRAVLDFDGDNKTDYAVTRNIAGNTRNWYLQRSTAGFLGQAWGAGTDLDVPGDYDGDLKWDIAVWRPGSPAVFYIFQSQTSTLRVLSFGVTLDDPRITQDFDGDHLADPAVARNVGGSKIWYIQRSMLGFTSVTFGTPSDIAIQGDFDGDGKADQAVYRNSGGSPAFTFFVLRSLDGGVQAQTFGNNTTDYVLPSDFDGDGKTDYTVWRHNTATCTFYWLHSSDGSFHFLNFGTSGDIPVPGDYDGDGKSDQAVWRPGATSTFYVNRSMLGFVAFPFGANTDSPTSFYLLVH